MAPVTHLWVVMSAYGQTPVGVWDNKGKLVQYLRALPEIPYLTFFKIPIAEPLRVIPVNILELLPDYVPPGEEG